MNELRSRIPARALVLVLMGALLVSLPGRLSAAGLIAYYPMDGNGNDASGNGYNLDLHGGAGFASGLFGQALDLHHNGSQFASRPVSDAAFNFGAGDFTISIWANFASTSGEQVLIEKWDGSGGPGWTLTKLDGNGLRFATGFDPGGILNSPTETIAPGTWHDFVVRRTGSSFTLDLDGSVVATATSSSAIAAAVNPLLIGKRDTGDGRDFSVNGRLDETAIWNYGLSDADVAKLWNGGNGTPANSLTAVPEPGSSLLLLLGIGVVAASRFGRHMAVGARPR